MADDGADEVRENVGVVAPRCSAELRTTCQVVLEAETTNEGALRLYSRAGFLRDKRLGKYYLSGADAYRLKLLLPQKAESEDGEGEP